MSNIALSRLGFATLVGGIALMAQAGAVAADASKQEPSGDAAQAAPAADAQRDALTEIVVTGTRLGGASGFTTPTPVTVLNAELFEKQAATNVAEVLNQMPAFRPQDSPATSNILAANLGASTADLRGLGASRTLVLIDGRRVVASTVGGPAQSTPGGAVDLNMIPSTLLERVDVVTGGASAAYGSDAVAGVVNLILNKTLTGFKSTVQYGETRSGDEEYLVSLAGGLDLGSRGHLVLGGEYVNNKGAGNCYTRDWCAQDYNVVSNPSRTNGLPASIVLPNTEPGSTSENGLIAGVYRGNVFSSSGPLVGQEFRPDGTTYAHNYGTYYGAGLFQGGGDAPRSAWYENFNLSQPVERYSLFGHVNYELTETITGTVQASYGHVAGNAPGAQTRFQGIPGSALVITRDNAYLPAGVASVMDANGITRFNLGRVFQDIGPSLADVERSTSRILGALDGKLAAGFTWNAYYQYGRTDYHSISENNGIIDNIRRAVDAVVGPDGNIVCRSTLTDPTNPLVAGCQPLNPFGVGNYSAAAVAYTQGSAVQDTQMTQQVVAATVQGDLFDIWGGPVSLAAGAEYREEEAHGTADAVSQANRFYQNPAVTIDGKLNVKEGFVEVGVPLARDLAFAKQLDLNGAIRLTDYSTSGNVTSWKVGGNWAPSNSIRFRATRSRDIRAANLFELYSPASAVNSSVIDPVLSSNYNTRQINRGNPTLDPEIADTWTAGIVLEPDFFGLDGLHLSVDYFDIDVKGAVANLGTQVLVSKCAEGLAQYCQFVQRDPASNAVVLVTNQFLNLNNVIVRGLDLEAAYSLPLSRIAPSLPGRINARVLATHNIELTTIDITGSRVDRAGMNGAPVSQPSGVPNWELNGYLGYSVDRFGFEVQVRYLSSGVYLATAIGPDQAGYSTTLSNSISDNYVPSMTYVNLNAQYSIVKDAAKNIELFASVNNLFDRDPPNDLPSSSGVTNPVLYDVLGRMVKVGARVTF